MYKSSVFVQPNAVRRITTNSRTLILQHPSIPHPVERQLWVLEGQLNNDSIYWPRANQYHMSARTSSLRHSPGWFVHDFKHSLWKYWIVKPSLYIMNILYCCYYLVPDWVPFPSCVDFTVLAIFFKEDVFLRRFHCFTVSQHRRVTSQPVTNLIQLKCFCNTLFLQQGGRIWTGDTHNGELLLDDMVHSQSNPELCILTLL